MDKNISAKVGEMEMHLKNIEDKVVALQSENDALKSANGELQIKAGDLITKLKLASEDTEEKTTLTNSDVEALDALAAHIASLDSAPDGGPENVSDSPVETKGDAA